MAIQDPKMPPQAAASSQPKGLEALNAVLPPPPQPIGSYVPALVAGNLVYTSGCLPMKEGRLACTGPVGGIEVSVSDAQEAARLCVMNALSAIRAQIGDLRRLKRVVKVTGFINSAQGFSEQPAVLNGASNFLVEYLGEAGRHVRSAVGVSALPMDASVEVEVIAELFPA